MKICPICKKTYEDEEDYCEDCGALLTEIKENVSQGGQQPMPIQTVVSAPSVQANKKELHKCVVCGWEGETDEEYCPECGAKLGGTVPVGGQVKEVLVKLILPDSTEINIDAYPFHFGRALMSSYPDSDTISREHFIITLTETNGKRTFEIEDPGSLNGTSLNEKVIGYDRKSKGKFPIVDGDKISLNIDPSTGKGKFELVFKVINNHEKI